MQILFEDKDLEELIMTGYNNKYKKYTRNAKFMEALATAYTTCGLPHVPMISALSHIYIMSNLNGIKV